MTAMTANREANDKVYADEAQRALGRMFALTFIGMIEGGMTRTEALTALCSYVAGLAANQASKTNDEPHRPDTG
jgi:hypothetical protein